MKNTVTIPVPLVRQIMSVLIDARAVSGAEAAATALDRVAKDAAYDIDLEADAFAGVWEWMQLNLKCVHAGPDDYYTFPFKLDRITYVAKVTGTRIQLLKSRFVDDNGTLVETARGSVFINADAPVDAIICTLITHAETVLRDTETRRDQSGGHKAAIRKPKPTGRRYDGVEALMKGENVSQEVQNRVAELAKADAEPLPAVAGVEGLVAGEAV